jgi:radical SAM protein with 4Fe4S-binding SPASM domain
LEGVCGKCIFKRTCLGMCRAVAYPRTRSFVTPFGFCQEALEKGLFPKTRLL